MFESELTILAWEIANGGAAARTSRTPRPSPAPHNTTFDEICTRYSSTFGEICARHASTFKSMVNILREERSLGEVELRHLPTRWITTRSSKVNLPHAIDLWCKFGHSPHWIWRGTKPSSSTVWMGVPTQVDREELSLGEVEVHGRHLPPAYVDHPLKR